PICKHIDISNSNLQAVAMCQPIAVTAQPVAYTSNTVTDRPASIASVNLNSAVDAKGMTYVTTDRVGTPNVSVSPIATVMPSISIAQPRVVEKSNGINEIQLCRLAKEGVRPVVVEKFGCFETQIKYIKEPETVFPYFAVIEEYTTCSYLGDYSAGRTIKTFSLLPGEKTTITVRTYKDITSTKSYSQNILDSF